MKSKRIGLQRYLLITCLDYCSMVGDKQQSLSLTIAAKMLQQALLSLCIKCRRSLVEQENPTRAKQRTGDGYALCLPLAQAITQLIETSVESMGQLQNKISLGDMKHLMQFLIRSFWTSHTKIVTHCSAEEGIALGYIDQISSCQRRDLHPFTLG